jgi:glycerate-2-kinase
MFFKSSKPDDHAARSGLVSNRDELENSPIRKNALSIIEAGMEAVLPKNFFKNTLSFDERSRSLFVKGVEYPLWRGRIFVVGGGKAAAHMARMFEIAVKPHNITAGIINTKGGDCRTSVVKCNVSGHPVPDERGMAGVREMLSFKDKFNLTSQDLVVCLISGGASSMMPLPTAGITLADKRVVTSLLLGSGASIHEMNAVRKHLSAVKGGWLRRRLMPARVVTIAISDVIGDDSDVIGSGPTVADRSTFPDVQKILHKYNLLEKIPTAARKLIDMGAAGAVEETPKHFDSMDFHLVGTNRVAIDAMVAKAFSLGYQPAVITHPIRGETGDAARIIAKAVAEGSFKSADAVIGGGETTPTLPERPGRGGRNQHYVAVTLFEMSRLHRTWLAASVGTDGSDYLLEVAGAMADSTTLPRAMKKGLDVREFIRAYDSNTFFEKVGNSLIRTGATGTNVGDVVLYLLK